MKLTKIRRKIILAFFFLLIPIITIGVTSFWGLNQIQQNISQKMTQNIKILKTSSELNSLTQFIRYYDEVLTQSARNYAFTSDKKWKDRYEQNAVLLDNNIKEAIRSGDEEDKQLFHSVDDSNVALVKMEEASIGLVVKGQPQEAVKILNGAEYAKQKKIYQDALVKYFEKQGKKYSDTLITSAQETTQTIKYVQESINTGIVWTVISLIFTCLMAIILGLFTGYKISHPISVLAKTAKEISAGNLSVRADVKSKDEIGELAISFNEMTDKLQQTQVGIEAKVKERTAELEKTNKYMTGRELKMIELKKKITELENKNEN
jgi:nitrogen fixation/metabolism regulation signal transduction histidine kinase